MGAGRIAGVAGAIAVVAIGAFLLWSAGTPTPPAAPGPAAAPRRSVQTAPDAAATASSETDSGVSAPPSDSAAASPSPAAPAGPGRIEGSIRYTDDEHSKVPEVLVLLSRGPIGSTEVVARTRSDAEGRFTFSGVALGEHSFCTLTREEETWDYEHPTAEVKEDGPPVELQLRVERPLDPANSIPVTGTVRYGDGRPAARFRFEFDADDGSFLVSGTDGAFRRRLPAAGKYTIGSVIADEQEWEDLDLEVDFVEGTPVAVVLPLPSEAVLQVVARGTGAPIPTARVHRFVNEERAWLFDEHPNPATLAAEPLRVDDEGRVSLGTGTGTESVFVIADGFAWRQVDVRRDGRGAAKVALEPGGTLRLSIPGWAALPDAHLVVESSEPWGRWELPAPGPEGAGTYTGIAARDWTVFVRRGMAHKKGQIYGEAAVTVPAGGEVSLTIEANAPEARRPVAVYGTVVLPAEWGARRTSISFEGADPSNADLEKSVPLATRGDGGPIPFILPGVPPGEYHVTIDPQFREKVTVPAEGRKFEFRVPPPGTLLLRLVDDATEAPVPRARILWYVRADRNSHTLEDAAPGDAPGTHRITAPAGNIRVWIEAPGYAEEELGEEADSETGEEQQGGVAVAAGAETVITVRMKRAGSVQITLKCEGDPPDWDDLNMHLVRKTDHDSRTWHWLEVSRGKAVTDDAPVGAWEVRVEGLEEEFEEVPPTTVTVVAGETATVEVTLVRKK